MLEALYKLPRFLLVSLLIGGGLVFILLNDPPHTLCDTQVEHFKKTQKGILYENPKDFHEEKSILKRKQEICQKEGSQGSCYDYFVYLKRLLRDFRILSEECAPLLYNSSKVKQALSSALSLMTALAWNNKLVVGKAKKYNWLTRSDLFLFCQLKTTYISQYGRAKYTLLEEEIFGLLPLENKTSSKFLLKKTLLSESCQFYR